MRLVCCMKFVEITGSLASFQDLNTSFERLRTASWAPHRVRLDLSPNQVQGTEILVSFPSHLNGNPFPSWTSTQWSISSSRCVGDLIKFVTCTCAHPYIEYDTQAKVSVLPFSQTQGPNLQLTGRSCRERFSLSSVTKREQEKKTGSRPPPRRSWCGSFFGVLFPVAGRNQRGKKKLELQPILRLPTVAFFPFLTVMTMIQCQIPLCGTVCIPQRR